jgi:hypothetical protein
VAYDYKRTLTIDATQCGSADSSNFPVLVKITDATLKTAANSGHVQNSNGYDIGFFSDSSLSSALFWEMDSYDGTAGTVIAWVKVPTVSHTANTVIYMGYGDSGISTFQSTATSAWDSNFKTVWHFGGSGPSMSDSTTNATTLTSNTGTAATGLIDGAVAYASGQSSSSPDAAALNINFGVPKSFSFWAFPTSTSGYQGLYSTGDFQNWILLRGAGDLSEQIDGTFNDLTLTTKWTVNAWNHIVVTAPGSGGTGSIYVNGVSSATFSAGTTARTDSAAYIGAGGGYQFLGSLDEVRVSNVVRSASWVLAEYNNQKASSTFLSIGSEGSTFTPPPISLSVMSHLFGWFDIGNHRIN